MRRAAAPLAIVLAAVAASAAIAANPSVTAGAATGPNSSGATSSGTVGPRGESTRTAGPSAQLPGPTPVTGAATEISASGARLDGTVDPNGREARWWFEIGPTTAYGVQTAPRSAGAGGTPVTVSARVNGLRAGAVYHYRLVSVGPGGTVVGGDATFTTGQSAHLAFFGHTAFTSPSRVTGIFLGCLGTSACQGSLRLSRAGTPLGGRRSFHISAQDGGIIHVTLSDLGARLLRARGALRVQVDVVGPGSLRVVGVVTLRRFV